MEKRRCIGDLPGLCWRCAMAAVEGDEEEEARKAEIYAMLQEVLL